MTNHDLSSAPRPVRSLLLLALTFAAVASGCGVEETVMAPFRGETPHERYLERLERSGLAETALVRDWTGAASEALTAPVQASPPMDESGWFPPDSPAALGYRLEMERGQRLRVELDLEGDEDARVFIEVFRLRGDADAQNPSLLTVAWGDSLSREVSYDAATAATYLVRVQPELLRGGPYRVSLHVGPSLTFPVEGAHLRDIGSYFGASREGGARQHHGVDIFAPRGTPVLAAGEGRVRRVQETPIGGKVVWVRNEEGGHSEYYAHLDTQYVTAGQRVSPGDTLGRVGNTGNAITTPPHLHFGIYSGGPVDPLPFLAHVGGEASPLRVGAELFHTRVRVVSEEAAIRAGPSEQSESLESGIAGLPLHILGGSGEWARVRLPDGRQGFIRPGDVEPAEDMVAWHRAAHAAAMESTPTVEGP